MIILEEVTVSDLFLQDLIHFTRKDGKRGLVENLHVHPDGTVTIVLKMGAEMVILHCQPTERVVLERTAKLDPNAVKGL